MKLLIELVLCHLIGDYVLQCDFIAKSKGENMYHLLVHCALYTLPFMYLFGVVSWKSFFIFGSHMYIDLLKSEKKINYVEDQILHYFCLIFLFILPI